MPTLRERLLGQSSPTPRYGAGTLRERLLGTGTRRVPTAPGQNTIFSGNLFEDVIDVLQVPQYALVGLSEAARHQEEAGRGYNLKGLWEGVKSGVKGRASWRDFLKEHELFGVSLKGKPEWVSTAIGTVLDMFVDPADMVIGPAVGLAGRGIAKGSKAVGLTDALRAAPAPQGLLNLARKYSDYTLRGDTLGEVVDTLAKDKKLLAKLSKLDDARIQEADRLMEDARSVVAEMRQAPKEVRKLWYDYITTADEAKRASILKQLPKGYDAKKFTELAERGADSMVKLGDELEALGMLSKETREKWGRNYLHRSFQKYEDHATFITKLKEVDPVQAALFEEKLKRQNVNIGRGYRMTDAEFGPLTMRQELPEKILQDLGEIKDAPYALMKGATLESNAVAHAKFFRNVADEFAKDLADEATAIVNGYRKMPESANWGALSGKYVPEVVHKQLTDAAQSPTDLARLLQQGVGWWKYGKVALNPATHVRNTLTNFALMDWGTGLTPLTPRWWKHLGQAIKALWKKNEDFKEAKAAGTFLIDTFTGRELPQVLRETEELNPNKLMGLFGWLRAAGKKAGDLYQLEEQMGKMTLFLAKRDEYLRAGLSRADAARKAAEEAEKWLFNYRKVPKWVDMMRNPKTGPGYLVASPFITFSYKAATTIPQAALAHPTRLTKYFKAGRGIEALSDEEETAAERRVMPDWMKRGLWLKLPWKDRYGRSLFLDATYLMPLADLASTEITGPGQKPVPMAAPLGTLLVDIIRNHSQFTGKPIYEPGTSKNEVAERIGAYLEYAWRNLAPPLAPGGYGWKNLADAIAKRPDWLGRTRTLDYVLAAQLAGLKTRPLSYSEEASWRAKEFEDQINQTRFALRKQMANPAISEEEKEEIWNNAVERINWLLERMNETLAPPSALVATGR